MDAVTNRPLESARQIGICQDRKAQVVYAFEHEEVLGQVRHAQQRADVLEALVRQLACTTPRKGAWESSYGALQNQARRAVQRLRNAQQARNDSR